jgi:hypothetical protein
MRERAAIALRKNLELRGFQVRSKFPHDGAKRGQVDVLEIGARRAELLEQAHEMVWSAANRNGRETIGFGKVFIGQQLFPRESQQEAQVLSRGWQNPSFRREEGAEIRRRDELQSERGKTGFEDAALERLDLTTGWNDDDSGALIPPGFRSCLLEPAFRRALPGRFRRRGKQQRVPAVWLKLQFQLHSLILAELNARRIFQGRDGPLRRP